jgi:hypothetical protein
MDIVERINKLLEDTFAKTTARSTGGPTVSSNSRSEIEKRKKAYAAQKKKWAEGK